MYSSLKLHSDENALYSNLPTALLSTTAKLNKTDEINYEKV